MIITWVLTVTFMCSGKETQIRLNNIDIKKQNVNELIDATILPGCTKKLGATTLTASHFKVLK